MRAKFCTVSVRRQALSALVGPKKSIANVIILGPARPATQVEVSYTDARTLGVSAPVRESGDVCGSAPCKIVGPCGEVEISEGVIVAKRHIHFTPEEAEAAGVADKEIVSVKIDSADRSTVFGDVVVRVSPKFAGAMHIDTDEANAACDPAAAADGCRHRRCGLKRNHRRIPYPFHR